MPIRKIRNVIALLTNQCQCACPYCFEERSPERMSLDTAIDILNFVKEGGGSSSGFTFFGGEPMLEFETIIIPLIEYSENTSIPTRFAMTTNGTLLDKERIEWLARHNVSYMLSFDGDKPTQDLSRPMRNGKSSFDAIMTFLPDLLRSNPQLPLRATLITENVPNFYHDILFLASLGVKDFSVLPNFFEIWDQDTKTAFLAELAKYNEYLVSSYEAGQRPLLINPYRSAFYDIVLTLQTSVRRGSANCITTNQCGLGVRGSASVDYRGDLYGCHHIHMTRESPFYIGNVYDGIDEARIINLIESYTPTRVGNEHCTTCPIDKICNGGCSPNNYALNGDVHIVSEGWCFWKQAIVTAADNVMRELARRENQLFLQDFKWCMGGRFAYV